MYGCVLMCNGKKTTITAVCRDSQWWGNHQDPKCPKDGKVCDQYDLEGPETGGSWTCEYNSCVFMCDANGKQVYLYSTSWFQIVLRIKCSPSVVKKEPGSTIIVSTHAK